jgi:hypothetical protein
MAESWRFEPKLKKPKKGFCRAAEEFEPEAFVLETFGNYLSGKKACAYIGLIEKYPAFAVFAARKAYYCGHDEKESSRAFWWALKGCDDGEVGIKVFTKFLSYLREHGFIREDMVMKNLTLFEYLDDFCFKEKTVDKILQDRYEDFELKKVKKRVFKYIDDVLPVLQTRMFKGAIKDQYEPETQDDFVLDIYLSDEEDNIREMANQNIKKLEERILDLIFKKNEQPG